jgi:hypothetical protein
MKMVQSSDPWLSIVILLAFALFGFALFTHGFTYNLLLETAIFLVSLQLILMAGKNTGNTTRLERRMEELLKRMEERRDLEER